MMSNAHWIFESKWYLNIVLRMNCFFETQIKKRAVWISSFWTSLSRPISRLVRSIFPSRSVVAENMIEEGKSSVLKAHAAIIPCVLIHLNQMLQCIPCVKHEPSVLTVSASICHFPSIARLVCFHKPIHSVYRCLLPPVADGMVR